MYSKHFSINCVVSLGVCVLDLLEKLHNKGFLHCDLKPDNILIGNVKRDKANMNKIHLIGFANSKSYNDYEGNHLKQKNNVPFRGNVIFSSKTAFEKKSLSRKDDIISLVYVLAYLVNSSLPWFDSNKPISDQLDSIAGLKSSAKP